MYLMESVALFLLKTGTFETRFSNITNMHIGRLGSPYKPKFYVTLLSSIFSRLLKNDVNLPSYKPDHSGSFHCLAFFRRVFRSGFHNIPAAGHIKLKQAERTTVGVTIGLVLSSTNREISVKRTRATSA